MQTYIPRRPLLFTLTLWLIMMVILIVCGGVAQQMALSSSSRPLLFGAVLTVSGILATGFQHAGRAIGFRVATNWRLVLPLLLLPALNLARGFHADLGLFLTLVLGALLAGFNEELWFRGLIQRTLALKGEGWAIWGSSVLFGVLHLLNALTGQDLTVTLIQIGYAFVLGVLFALIRLRTGSLWPTVLIHALTNLFAWTAQRGQIGSGGVDSLFDLLLPAVVVVLGAGYSLYLWRSRRLPLAEAA